MEMAPDETPKAEAAPSDQPKAPRPAGRGGRRSGRGRRGRGRPQPRPHQVGPVPVLEEPPQDLPPSVGEDVEGVSVPETVPAVSEPLRPAVATPTRDFRPASPVAMQQALEEVNRIIDTLRETLDDMEEVLETLELAERQKDTDEREIEQLRRSLHQLHRPREGGHPSHQRHGS